MFIWFKKSAEEKQKLAEYEQKRIEYWEEQKKLREEQAKRESEIFAKKMAGPPEPYVEYITCPSCGKEIANRVVSWYWETWIDDWKERSEKEKAKWCPHCKYSPFLVAEINDNCIWYYDNDWTKEGMEKIKRIKDGRKK